MQSASPDNTGFYATLRQHLSILYPDANCDLLAGKVAAVFDGFDKRTPLPLDELWSQEDSLLITYGDSIVAEDEKPLQTLHRFLDQHLKDACSAVHIGQPCTGIEASRFEVHTALGRGFTVGLRHTAENVFSDKAAIGRDFKSLRGGHGKSRQCDRSQY